MDELSEIGRDIQAAAEVHAARRRVTAAIADLSAAPLDERAAARLAGVLSSPEIRRARQVLRPQPQRPSRGLSAVAPLHH